MNEEIEYAEMLEIPVSTVNVVKKTRRRRKKAAETSATAAPATPLKDSVIAQVNDRLNAEPSVQSLPDPTPLSDLTREPEHSEQPPVSLDPAPMSAPPRAQSDPFADSVNSEGYIEFDPVPDRIDTVRLYATENPRDRRGESLEEQVYQLREDYKNEGGRYTTKREKRSEKAIRIALSTEFAVACALCGAIFFTNVFMPNSAINTFFRALSDPATQASKTDDRVYSDFTLSPVVSDLSDATLTLSEAGVLSFQDDCHVYPAANGTVSEITKTEDVYTLKISYSDTFTGVIHGLDQVYYAVGDEVKSNIPVGYTAGEKEVQVTMYSSGELLNCFELTEENCLAWVDTAQ